MSRILMPSSPIHGHVAPMIQLGRGLLEHGHRSTVLTGTKYRAAVERAGLDFLPLPAEADYDDADLDAWLPGRDRYKGLAAVRHDITGMFLRPLPAQHRALTAALATGGFDLVLSESAFLGSLPTLLAVPATERVPVLGISALPMTLTSVDCAPFGPALPPGRSALARLRNRALNGVLHAGPLKPLRTAFEAALAEVGAPPARGNVFDQLTAFDLTFQLSARGLEYPRRELPSTVHFVGPMRPAPRPAADLPAWWGDLDGGRPVVHVTQGTTDNADPTRLLAPAITALAGEDVLVVATTGGRPVAELLTALGGELPANARVGEFLPYDRLLPRTDVLVTNGGFGGVQQALAHGVPLVVAGATEDKPEVAARVAWAGAGVNLRTGSPAPQRIRRAVRRVLHDGTHRRAAVVLQSEIAGYGDPVATVAAAVADLTSSRAATGPAA
ncbi:glycosyltransferase [Kineococcus glutinatus]|uniref:Glycosyltransferase n=1 Tax=Kineococcus glutinatus TaxID=1070872 RepID=A0ABP9HYA2_9ACTN